MVYVAYGVNKVINAMNNSERFELLEEKAIRRDWRQTKRFCNSISVIQLLETPLMLTDNREKKFRYQVLEEEEDEP